MIRIKSSDWTPVNQTIFYANQQKPIKWNRQIEKIFSCMKNRETLRALHFAAI